jgi:hypothetical protein
MRIKGDATNKLPALTTRLSDLPRFLLLSITAVQEAETLTKTAKSIIFAQGSVQGKWNRGYSNTA